MKQEYKELLLKDLCARLPYGVEVEYNNSTCEVLSIDKYNEELTIWKCPVCYPDIELEDAKPYLFPMSSMTKEQIKEFNSITQHCSTYTGKSILLTDFCNRHHIDWRGLIPMGLANDAIGLNIY